jgi:DNA-binding MarR family transcriptional regulator
LHEEDGLMIGVVSQRCGIDAPTVTGIVKRLEQVSLVERVHDLADRRVVRVYLTEEGKELKRLLPPVVETFSQIALRGVPEAQQAEMLLFLQKTIANLATIGPGTGDRFGLLPDHVKD